MVDVELFVPGTPQTKGSAKAFMRPGMKHPAIVNDNSKNKSWEGQVKHALLQLGSVYPRQFPVAIQLRFCLLRPKGHYRSGKNATLLAGSAPARHVSKPDLDKLVRSVKDALKGIAYADDSQVCDLTAKKHYVDRFTGTEGVEILVTYLDADAG